VEEEKDRGVLIPIVKDRPNRDAISQRLPTPSGDIICAMHSPAISTIRGSRLIDGGVCVRTRTDGEMNERAERRETSVLPNADS